MKTVNTEWTDILNQICNGGEGGGGEAAVWQISLVFVYL